jgi:hypothetical protein
MGNIRVIIRARSDTSGWIQGWICQVELSYGTFGVLPKLPVAGCQAEFEIQLY